MSAQSGIGGPDSERPDQILRPNLQVLRYLYCNYSVHVTCLVAVSADRARPRLPRTPTRPLSRSRRENFRHRKVLVPSPPTLFPHAPPEKTSPLASFEASTDACAYAQGSAVCRRRRRRRQHRGKRVHHRRRERRRRTHHDHLFLLFVQVSSPLAAAPTPPRPRTRPHCVERRATSSGVPRQAPHLSPFWSFAYFSPVPRMRA